MFAASIEIFDPDIKMSVRTASTLSFSPWISAVPFLSRRFLFWSDIMEVGGSVKSICCWTCVLR